MVYHPILERGGSEVWIYTTEIVIGLDEEMNKNWVARSSSRFYGVIFASEISVPLWGPLFDLKGNHVWGVLLAPEILTYMRLVSETLEDSSCWVWRRLYLILLVRSVGVYTPLLSTTGWTKGHRIWHCGGSVQISGGWILWWYSIKRWESGCLTTTHVGCRCRTQTLAWEWGSSAKPRLPSRWHCTPTL